MTAAVIDDFYCIAAELSLGRMLGIADRQCVIGLFAEGQHRFCSEVCQLSLFKISGAKTADFGLQSRIIQTRGMDFGYNFNPHAVKFINNYRDVFRVNVCFSQQSADFACRFGIKAFCLIKFKCQIGQHVGN